MGLQEGHGHRVRHHSERHPGSSSPDSLVDTKTRHRYDLWLHILVVELRKGGGLVVWPDRKLMQRWHDLLVVASQQGSATRGWSQNAHLVSIAKTQDTNPGVFDFE